MKSLLIILYILTIAAGCKKFVDVGPPVTQLSTETVFSSDQAATGAILAIYSRLESDGQSYQLIFHTGLTGDELTNYSTGTGNTDMYTNNMSADNGFMLIHWRNFYKYIYQANALLGGLASSSKLSADVKMQLEGEARFVRAFCYFYLVNLYGDVPLSKNTDYAINAALARSPANEVYSFIISDLQAAIPLLSSNYLNGNNQVSPERVRPNRFAAAALLARAYLYTGNWTKTEEYSNMVIAASTLYTLPTNLDLSFLKVSAEAIWQLQNVISSYNAYAGAQLILTSRPTLHALDTHFVNSFRPNDKRKLSWVKSITASGINYPFPFKYKVKSSTGTATEYTMAMRLAEQFLIRAEARARQGNINGGDADLNVIRVRAGLPAITSSSETALLDSISIERRYELFTEFGDRWLDLKRTGRINLVMPMLKGNNWAPTDALYPVPLAEINRNPNLTQNPGY